MTDDVLIKERHHLLRSRRVAPIPHQFQGNREHGEYLHTSVAHTVVGILSSLDIEGTGSVTVGEHAVAFGPQRQREERRANLQLESHFSALRTSYI